MRRGDSNDLGRTLSHHERHTTDPRLVYARIDQAIGAQVSHPGRQVISMSGDGGFALLMGDLLTLKQHQSPVKIVVFKNDSLAFVELEMKAAGSWTSGLTAQSRLHENRRSR